MNIMIIGKVIEVQEGDKIDLKMQSIDVLGREATMEVEVLLNGRNIMVIKNKYILRD